MHRSQKIAQILQLLVLYPKTKGKHNIKIKFKKQSQFGVYVNGTGCGCIFWVGLVEFHILGYQAKKGSR